MKHLLQFAALITIILLAGCNKDEVIYSEVDKPKIYLDSEYGVYTVKVGGTLTIAPDYENIENGTVTWTMDGSVVYNGLTWTSTWPERGEYYVAITATNSAGSTTEEVRVDVVDLTPPVISMMIPADGLKVAAGEEYLLVPDVQHSDMEGFAMEWYVDGEHVGDGPSYTFSRETPGTYRVAIVARNIDGESRKEFDIEVLATKPYAATFLPVTGISGDNTRYTFAGRAVYLQPVISCFTTPAYRWQVSGGTAYDAVELDGGSIFAITPVMAGEYTVEVTVTETGSTPKQLTRNVSRTGLSATAHVTVVCVDATEESRMRPATAASSAYCTRVFDYLPAPGQFINQPLLASADAAAQWAKSRLDAQTYVSLGAFGGYIVVGFDHSVPAGRVAYDLAIGGNAFANGDGNSNEPGVVWVMQDVNGNGLPDDEWYELKGSDFDAPATRRAFGVTYFRPEGSHMAVKWMDADGLIGDIDYLTTHPQDSYYPAWVTATSYTLYGTLLPSRTKYDSATGFWSTIPAAWGYADNGGSDSFTDNTADGQGQYDAFSFANAVNIDGSPVALQYVDFVMVQSGTMAKCGLLGEVSTEVLFFQDYSMRR